MKTEGELFEAWYSSAYSETIHMLPNGQYSSLRCQHSWDAWQASAKREGYKFVPVEPPEDMDIKICRLVDHRIDVFEADRIYKAMIGAAP